MSTTLSSLFLCGYTGSLTILLSIRFVEIQKEYLSVSMTKSMSLYEHLSQAMKIYQRTSRKKICEKSWKNLSHI